MKAIGIIPARYRSKRFEGKVLAPLGGKPIIRHVYERSRQASLLDDVFVATDDARVAEVVEQGGGKVIMTSPDHLSGTDRVAQAAKDLDVEVVVNIQGDEPFISPRAIDQSVEPFLTDPELQMCTLMRLIEDIAAAADPNVVKVVVDRQGYALYFSRSLIPYPREGRCRAFEHIGLYAYRKGFLLRFAALPPTELERVEGLEQLRALENGHNIRVILTEHHPGLSIDTPADLERAEAFLAQSRPRRPIGLTNRGER